MTFATRISRLETKMLPDADPPRIFVSFVGRKGTESALLAGQWFTRNESESEDEFAARARAAAGWPNE
jgi:hypothetical protein